MGNLAEISSQCNAMKCEECKAVHGALKIWPDCGQALGPVGMGKPRLGFGFYNYSDTIQL